MAQCPSYVRFGGPGPFGPTGISDRLLNKGFCPFSGPAFMIAPRFLGKNDFAHIVRHAPLVSIDIIIRDPEQNVLLGRRMNEPAKGTYFVPGGIVRKNETIGTAFSRILRAEVSADASLTEARFVGVFEHIYETNAFGSPDYGTHCVVLAYEINLTQRPMIQKDFQHDDLRWMSENEILSTTGVHPNTQAYFR